ncbi:MAG: glycerol-3-phosphate dehydrogenase/oxidase, partial [Gemmatimonadetes bacterium]|nr:glycerol-3-phosphate dehydrogenase/oxidase [Gemmatimonadota bacterium]
FVWSQSYFLLEREDGRVGINRGFPFARLAAPYRSSDVVADDLSDADRERLVQSHRILSRSAVLAREPGLRSEGLRGAALYYDAQVDDARLTLAVARAAHEAGATLVSHARVTGFTRAASDGAVSGVRVVDAKTGAEIEVAARLVLSATGPWTDELRQLLDPAAAPRLRPTKGVHIQLRRLSVGNRGAITLRSPIDQRVMFVLPWGEYTYVGTTDTDYPAEPELAEADRDDIDYLVKSLNAIFPGANATRADIVSSWTGVRPLVSPSDAEADLTASQTSREHEIWREAGGPMFVAGGKLTTYRVMAADAADAAVKILRREHHLEVRKFDTAPLPLPGTPPGDWSAFKRKAVADGVRAGLRASTAEHLASKYGSDVERVLALVGEERGLGEAVVEGHPEIWAEVVHAVRAEMALTVEDVLRRRLHLFYDAADGAVPVASLVARRMAAEVGLGWGEEEIYRQVQEYTRAVERTRQALAARPGA